MFLPECLPQQKKGKREKEIQSVITFILSTYYKISPKFNYCKVIFKFSQVRYNLQAPCEYIVA